MLTHSLVEAASAAMNLSALAPVVWKGEVMAYQQLHLSALEAQLVVILAQGWKTCSNLPRPSPRIRTERHFHGARPDRADDLEERPGP